MSIIKKINIVIVLTLLVLCGCENKLYKPSSKNYISFTLTYDDGELFSEVYYFNLDDEKVKKVAVVPYTAQYPLTVYDKVSNNVYYTSRLKGDNKDEVYAYSLDTKETTQITENLFAINYIIPYKNNIFLAAIFLGEKSVQPYIFNKNTKAMKNLSNDDDINISCVNKNPSTNEFVMSGYSIEQMYENIESQMYEDFEEPLNYLYYLSESSTFETIAEIKEFIHTVCVNDKYFYFSTNKFELIQIDKENKKQRVLLTKDDKINLDKILYVTNDNKFMYYIENKKILRYDFFEKDVKTIYEDKRERSKINNGMVLSY